MPHRDTPYARQIGRVGALAVALGVGFAIGSPIAWAKPEPNEASASSDGAGSATPDAAESASGTPTSGTKDDPNPAADPAEPKAIPQTAETETGLSEPTSMSSSTRAGKRGIRTAAEPKVRAALAEEDTEAEPEPPAIEVQDRPPARVEPAAPALAPVATLPEPELKAAEADLVATDTAAIMASPLSALDTGQTNPVEDPMIWVLAAAARREVGANAGGANLAPIIGTPVIGTPDPTSGAVTGLLVATDPENKKLTYTVTSAPAGLIFNTKTAAFSYTPTAAQRVQAALTPQADTVALAVTVSDGTNTVPATINVPIAAAPVFNLGQVEVGSGASGVAVTDTRAYVTNRNDGTVTVINTLDRTVVATIAVGSLPMNVAVTPDGSKVYVSNSGSDTVSVIDSATNTVVATVAVGDHPYGITLSPNGKTLYVANANDGTVTKIDTVTNKVSGTVRNAGEIPYNIVVSPDGKKVFVVNSAADYVTVFTASGSTATRIPVETGRLSYAVAVSPDGTRLYVAGFSDGKVTVFDTARYAVIDTFTVNGKPTGISFNKDGSLLLVTTNDGNVQVRDTTTSTVLTTLTISPAAMGTEGSMPHIAVSPDGMQAYITDSNSALLRVVSLVPANAKPTASIGALSAPDSVTGTVRGSVGAADADHDTLRLTASTPAKGRVVLTADGSFAYTPTAAARHAASVPGADTTDSFAITVSDGRRGVTTVWVTVNILPANSVPSAKLTTGKPNSSTGLVTGTVKGTDSDKDALSYSVTSGTDKGTVSVDARGKFTFTPTAAARHAAAATAATSADRETTLTITVSDGHGGEVEVPVKVAIGPANQKPTAVTTSAQPAHAVTGVVTGALTATDADGDGLTFSAPVTTKKGSVLVNADGTFTYTPSAAALAAAQAPKASLATKTDSFKVTVADSHGGATTAIVSVRMVPNRAPVINAPAVGNPNGAGVLTGRITATDPDGDKLTYSGSTTTAKGTVTVRTDGTFTYTPTATARLNAATASGPVTDTFMVSVSDAFGGSATVAVTTTVDPAKTILAGSVTVGNGASTVALKPDGTRAYVANYHDGTITVVNTATNKTVGSAIKIGALPQALAVSADGTRLYVAGIDTASNTGKVTVINTVTNKVFGPAVTIGSYPTGIVVSPDGSRIYVTDGPSNTVTVVDTATRTMLGTAITVGSFPTGIALSPNGTRAYVSNGGSNTVTVIDTRSGAVVGTPIAVGTLPSAIAVNATGTRAYVTNASSKTVTVIDTLTNAVVGSPITVNINPLSITVTPDGAFLHIGGNDGSLVTVSTATGLIIGTPLQAGSSLLSHSVSPDGTKIYAPDGLSSLTVIALSSTVGAPVAPTAPPPGTTGTNGAVTGTLGVTDTGKLTFTVAQKPALGTVTVKADGTYVYTPTAAARRYAATAPVTDTFTVNATNTRGVTTSSTVTVNVAPAAQAPVPPTLEATVSGYSTPYDVHNPYYTITNPSSYYAYTLNANRTLSGSSYLSLSVLDTRYNTLVGTPLQISFDVGGAALIPNGRYLYISDNNDAVRVVDTANNSVVATIPVALGPRDVVASPDSTRVYVAHYYGYGGYELKSVSVLDANAKTVIGSPIPVSIVPRQLVVSPDSRRLYVLDGLSGYVSVIDTFSRTVTGTISVGAFDEVQISSDGSRMYLGSITSTKVQVLDTTATVPSVLAPISVPGNNYAAEMALSPDGRRLYVAMATGRLSVIDTATRTVVANADYGGNPTLMTITPDGSRIFVVSTVVDAKGSHSLLSTYDAGSNTLIRASIDVGFLPTSMTLSTDGSRLYVADPATNNLYVIDTGKPGIAAQAPASTADLYAELRRLTDWPWSKTGVATQVVNSNVDQKSKLIVYLGGTHFDPTGDRYWTRNIAQYIGLTDSKVVAEIKDKLANLPPDTEVMLVGYSQGGLDAQNLAADWATKGLAGKVTTVVAFGSPINTAPTPNPNAYHSIFIRAHGDPVPEFDAFNEYLHRIAHDALGHIYLTDADTGKGGADLHADPQTYINIGKKFDSASVNTPWFLLIKSDLAKFRGTLVL